eukprot:2022747-Rhodomonas_salina.2
MVRLDRWSPSPTSTTTRTSRGSPGTTIIVPPVVLAAVPPVVTEISFEGKSLANSYTLLVLLKQVRVQCSLRARPGTGPVWYSFGAHRGRTA